MTDRDIHINKPSGKMMRVYQFVGPDGGLEILRTRRLRVSRLDRLNDPFEFLGVDLSHRARRRALQSLKQELGRDQGILCFSKSWHNPVLWGHYAYKHQGFCLGFDFPTELLRQVSYVTSRFPWPQQLSQSFMEQILCTKFVHWSYEDEYRAWVSLEESEGGHYYLPFSGNFELKQVLVGALCSVTRAELAGVLGDLVPTIECFKVRPAFRSFRVVRNRNEALWR